MPRIPGLLGMQDVYMLWLVLVSGVDERVEIMSSERWFDGDKVNLLEVINKIYKQLKLY